MMTIHRYSANVVKSFRYTFVLLVAIWALISGVAATWYAGQKTDAVVADHNSNALALYQAFDERLNYLAAIPLVTAELPVIARATERYSREPALRQAGASPKAYWSAQPELENLNAQLRELAKALQVDLIFVLNAEGYSIASSNSDTPESTVGTLYADRIYYQDAIAGNRAQQYAVGRTTNIPGFFYSAPVRSKGQITGVVVIKHNITQFQGLLDPYQAFVTDNHDVIILAHDPALLQHMLSHARFLDLDETQRLKQYKRTEFPILSQAPWGNGVPESLIRLDGLPSPALHAERALPVGGLAIHVYQEIPEIKTIQRERWVMTVAMALAGVAVFGLSHQLITYLRNLRQSKIMAEAESGRLHETLSDRERELRRLAYVDTLTNLPNRNALLQKIHRATANVLAHDQFGAIFLINMDDLKLINDRLGHSAGDAILVEFGNRLKICGETECYVSRLASDEFVLVFEPGVSTTDAAIRAVNEFGISLQERITAPYLISEHTIHITASIGVTLFGDGLSNTPEALLREVDAAMYEAKHSHRGGIHFFDESIRKALEAKADLGNRLLRALRSNEFVQVYQPQLDAQGRVAGVEALIRWHDEALGHVSPATFIPLAEALHIIVDIDRWVLARACQTAAQWANDPALAQIPISVNVSSEFFTMKNFVDEVTKTMTTYGARPEQLMIELTEGTLIADSEQNQQNIVYLHRQGIKVAIDDFGTGNSSLSYMQRFTVDQLKIDQSFVRDMLNDERSFAIVEFIIRLAHALNYHTLAEGVETAAQHEKLLALGCTLYQGYLFSKPLPQTECESFIRQSLTD
jgi:diguanylate cyclase (GGDEF)-like protein